MVDLEERVTQLENWAEGKGLIVQGAAGTFCSGSDLNAVRVISNPQVVPQRSRLLHTPQLITTKMTFTESKTQEWS